MIKYANIAVLPIRIIFFLSLLLVVLVNVPAYAATYYVAKNGSDNNPGSKAKPWLTIQKAADIMVAGDTVYIKQGTYYERVTPQNSGSEGKYITYQAYPGHEVIIKALNTWDYDFCIYLQRNKSLHYLRFIGLKLRGANWANFGAYADDAPKSNIIIDRLTSEGGKYGIYFRNGVTNSIIKNCEVHNNKHYGIHISSSCSNIVIENNHVSYTVPDGPEKEGTNISVYTPKDLPGKQCTNITITNNHVHHAAIQGIGVWHAHNVLVKGNYSHHNGASGIQIESWGTSPLNLYCKNIIVKDNICEYNSQKYDSETGIWIHDSEEVVVQNNIMRHNEIGLKLSGTKHTIVRNNLIYKNNGGVQNINSCGINMWADSEMPGGEDNIVVHNTFYQNGHGNSQKAQIVIGRSFTDPELYRTAFKNNIECESLSPVDMSVWYQSHILDYNDYFNNRDLKVSWQGANKTWQQYLSASGCDNNSITQNPLFVDPANKDFTLQQNSPCIDKGGFLTKTTNSGSGKTLVVENARYFTDGFGVIDGDLIQVGSNSTVRIAKVDYDTNTLTIDRSMSWKKGDGVSYPYSGSAPDIGAYE